MCNYNNKMRQIILLIITFAVCILTSCEKNEATSTWIQGMWCLTSREDYETGELKDSKNHVSWYWDLSSNGNFVYYQLKQDSSYQYASFSNGVLTKPQNTTWEKWMEGKYSLEDGKLYVADIVMYHITKISHDKARVDDSDWLVEGIAERVNKLQ